MRLGYPVAKTVLSKLFQKREKTAPVRLPLPDSIEVIRQKARLGYHLEQVLWGKTLLDSIYMPSDPQQAIIWFTMAAKAGYGPAHNMLGRCAHFGWGCDKDLQKAAQYYETAATLGDEWGRYNLGILTMRGIGMPQNLKQALTLFQTAAQNGHAKSMNILARFLEEGWEIPQDRQAALGWYKRSAEGGDYRGQHNYATALAEAGHIEEALKWWAQALPNATSDILLAMNKSLTKLGPDAAPDLYAALQERLKTLPLQTTETDPET
ncbi:tetratricopeptide repeat protein [Acetobacter indonesiensis]|uniref:tetratricopeptide repeat protein n=1 Tax=Acetobacter indonesiensis TaxID=104101 RepID=UPI0039E9D4AB